MSLGPHRAVAALAATAAVLVTAAALTSGVAVATAPGAGAPGGADAAHTPNTIDAANTVFGADTTADLSDTVENTTDNTTDAIDNTTDETTDAVENTTDNTTDTVDDTTDDTTDAVENTTDETTDAVENTTDNTTDTVDDTTDTVDGAVDSLAGLLDGANVTVAVGGEGDTSTTPTRETTRSDADAGTTDGAAGDSPDGTTPAAARDDGPAGSPWDGDGPDVPTGPAVGLAALLGGALLAGERGLAAVSQSGTGTHGLWHTLQALATHLRWWALRLLGLFGYSRYDDSDPLDHETRAAAYEFVRGSPGTHLAELADRVDVPVSTLRHHLRVLEVEGLVESDHARGRRRYFPAGADRTTPPSDAARSVLAALADGGRASVTELADRLDRDASTVSHHLDRLAEDGFVAREREGQAVTSELTAVGRRALAFPDGDGPRDGGPRNAGERSRDRSGQHGAGDPAESRDSPTGDTSRSVGGGE